MSGLELVSLLLLLTSVVSWLNVRLLRLPSSVGMLAVGAALAGALLLAGRLTPAGSPPALVAQAIRRFDFADALLGSVLGYLLFAGAAQTDWTDLRRRPLSIGLLSTLGVLVSTLIVGAGVFAVARLLGAPLSFAWALVFGALISPTDPVAVLAILSDRAAPAHLRGLMQGESLFNDGVGVVVFTLALAFARGRPSAPLAAALEVLREAGGGMAVGAAAGGLVILMMRAIDDYSVETGLSLALASGAYALSQRLGVSGPTAVVVAGLFIGNVGARYAMSERTQRYLRGFWRLVDDNLNALLFFALGLELVVVSGAGPRVWPLAAASVPIVALARAVSVAPTAVRLTLTSDMRPREAAVLIWGGLRGGISVAMALSVGKGPASGPILACTYAVVAFSILVQGLTFGRLMRWAVRGTGRASAPAA